MVSALESPDGTMMAEVTVPSDWGSGYCASVTVKNTGGSKTSAWGMVLGLNGSTMGHAWNARITQSNGQVSAINEHYNGELAAGASTMWGFCASGSGRPTVVSVDGSGGSGASTSTSASSGTGAGGDAGVGGGGGEGGGTTTAGTGGEGGDVTSGTGGAGGDVTSGTGGTGGDVTSGTGGEGGDVTSGTGAGGDVTSGTGGAGGDVTAGTGGAGGDVTAGTGGAGGDVTSGTGGAGGAGGGSTTTGAGGAPPLDPACGPDTAAFADVVPILERSCAGCHGNPAFLAGGLDLRPSEAVGALVNQDAGSCSSEQALVVPFMPSSSYLMNKLKDTGLCDPDESKMPPGASLPEAELKTINDWICAGAPAD
ncbi:cellulose binding domain-containing protein [Sorangium sp. So ce1078]|uniref:cellulose binding domain-containing protein n=1 Tax=Sorangium sp. So ce1078 TaxID=3133329 RepID=UPI003F5FDEA2